MTETVGDGQGAFRQTYDVHNRATANRISFCRYTMLGLDENQCIVRIKEQDSGMML